MNWYKRYIGDYQRDTGHLSLVEHGAYTLMLDTYYATSRPLPKEQSVLFRLLRAATKEEQVAAKLILGQFWRLTDDGWINLRAKIEIDKYEAQSSTNRRIARERSVPRSVDEPLHEQATSQIPDPRSQIQKPKPDVKKSSDSSSHSRLTPDQREIFTHWNSFEKLVTHKAFTPKMSKSLNARMNGGGWSVADICRAITRYAELRQAGTAPGYGKWGLADLLTRDEGAYLDRMLSPNYEGIIHETADDRRRKHNAALLGTDSKVSLLDG